MFIDVAHKLRKANYIQFVWRAGWQLRFSFKWITLFIDYPRLHRKVSVKLFLFFSSHARANFSNLHLFSYHNRIIHKHLSLIETPWFSSGSCIWSQNERGDRMVVWMSNMLNMIVTWSRFLNDLKGSRFLARTWHFVTPTLSTCCHVIPLSLGPVW